MKIGRNDPCPCGSGKKYKNCCLRKETMSIPDRIKQAVTESGYNEDIGNVLANMYRYMERKQWWGACHASCAALYVCLSELGYKPKLCIGEVFGQGLYFDHSWISLDDKMIDLCNKHDNAWGSTGIRSDYSWKRYQNRAASYTGLWRSRKRHRGSGEVRDGAPIQPVYG